jgi:hypothetical protein
MHPKKPAVLVVGKTSLIATAIKLIPVGVACSDLWLAGSVTEAREHLDARSIPSVVLTTIHPPWQSGIGHAVRKHPNDLHSIVIASHALSLGVRLVVVVNESEQPHMLAEIVLETMAHFTNQSGNSVIFLSGNVYRHGQHGVDWTKVLEDGLHGGQRWSPRAPRKSI